MAPCCGMLAQSPWGIPPCTVTVDHVQLYMSWNPAAVLSLSLSLTHSLTLSLSLFLFLSLSLSLSLCVNLGLTRYEAPARLLGPWLVECGSMLLLSMVVVSASRSAVGEVGGFRRSVLSTLARLQRWLRQGFSL